MDLGAFPDYFHSGGVVLNDLSASKASLSEQLVLKRLHLWIMALLYLATFGSFIGFSAGFAMLSKTQFPDADPALRLRPVHWRAGAFDGRGDLRPLGGTRVTLVNFVVMAVFCALLFLTPADQRPAVTLSPSSRCLWCCS